MKSILTPFRPVIFSIALFIMGAAWVCTPVLSSAYAQDEAAQTEPAPTPMADADTAEKKPVSEAVKDEASQDETAEKKDDKQTSSVTQENDYIGGMSVYIAKSDDTLLDIARRFNLGFVEVQAANQAIDPWIPGEGKKIVIPAQHLLPDAPRRGLVINLGDMRIYLYDSQGNPIKSVPVGVGRDGMKTPLGRTTIVRKKEGPWWYPTARMRFEDPSLPEVVKQTPQNPMGTHALYLGWPTYAIHGTNEPWGIGRRSSSGCMRMYPEDIAVMYYEVDVGTQVTVVDQPIKMGWIDGELYLEAHPNKEQASALEYEEALPLDFPNGIVQDITIKAGPDKNRIDWSVVREAVARRQGFPIQITFTGERPAPRAVKERTRPSASSSSPSSPASTSTTAPAKKDKPARVPQPQYN